MKATQAQAQTRMGTVEVNDDATASTMVKLNHGVTAFLNNSIIQGQAEQKYLKVSKYLGVGNEGQALFKSVNLSKEQIKSLINSPKVATWLEEEGED
jgi:hypothetical protein